MRTKSAEERKAEKLEKALQEIAAIPDCLYKGDATKMRDIARKALNDK